MSETNSSVMVSPIFVKPLVSGVTAFLLDKYVLGNTNSTSSAVFAGAVVVGTGASQVFSGLDLGILPDTQIYTGKTIAQRSIEIILGTTAAYAGNRFVLNNDFQPSLMGKKIGIIFASQVVGEYISDYMSAQPLSYLM